MEYLDYSKKGASASAERTWVEAQIEPTKEETGEYGSKQCETSNDSKFVQHLAHFFSPVR